MNTEWLDGDELMKAIMNRLKLMKEIMNRLTPRAQQIIAMADSAAHELGNNYIGVEHLELAITRYRFSASGINIMAKPATESDWGLKHAAAAVKNSMQRQKEREGKEGG